jgi:hypothetical protein
MQRALDEKNGSGQPPFRPLVDALAELLLEEFDLPADALCAEEGNTAAFVVSDPLHGPPRGRRAAPCRTAKRRATMMPRTSSWPHKQRRPTRPCRTTYNSKVA